MTRYLMLATIALACFAGDAQTAEEQGFVPLFDGKTLDGWVQRGGKAEYRVEDGQIVGRLVYDRLTEVPETLYGQGIGSHYQAQGLKLSKHFRQE